MKKQFILAIGLGLGFSLMPGLQAVKAQTVQAQAAPLLLAESFTKDEMLVQSAQDKASKEDYKGAISDMTAAIKLKPTADKYGYRASYYSLTQNYQAAIADSTKALEIDPSPYHYYQRSMTRIGIKDLKGAIADLSIVIKSNMFKDSPEASYALRGGMYAELGEHQKAVADFTQALKTQPNADFYMNRAASYVKLGNKAAAIKDYETAASLATAPEEEAMRGYALDAAKALK